MKFPLLPKRKADAISNGIFLILLGFLFYTGQWWPGILFALGLIFAIRKFLTGQRKHFFLIVAAMGLIGILTLNHHITSLFTPILLVGLGIYLIGRECFSSSRPISFTTHISKDDR